MHVCDNWQKPYLFFFTLRHRISANPITYQVFHRTFLSQTLLTNFEIPEEVKTDPDLKSILSNIDI